MASPTEHDPFNPAKFGGARMLGSGVEPMLLPRTNFLDHATADSSLELFKFYAMAAASVTRSSGVTLENYVTPPPQAFERRKALHNFAIVIPWLSSAAVWEELRYALRAIHANFADKRCPIYIIGDSPPSWLRKGKRVRWLGTDYSKDWRVGIWQARALGLQIAKTVLWMADDIFMIQPCDVESFRVPLTEGMLTGREAELLSNPSWWPRSLGTVAVDLQRAGFEEVWRYGTHTPFLYERDKAIKTMETFYLDGKASFETLYYTMHGIKGVDCAPFKAKHLPAVSKKRLTYNCPADGPSTQDKRELMRMFSEPAPWEDTTGPGFGDVLETLAKPVAKLTDAVLGTDLTNCGGCAGRRDWVNRMLPFSRRTTPKVYDLPAPPDPAVTSLPPETNPPLTIEVHTLRYGSADWLKECAPTLDDWCARHGHKLRVWTDKDADPGYPHPKFVAKKILEEFVADRKAQRCMFVDADVLIHPSAPEFPAGKGGFYMMRDTPTRAYGKWKRWMEEHYELRPDKWFYRNAGVWICDRASAILVLEQMNKREFIEGWMEQHQFNAWLYFATRAGLVLMDLPRKWNSFHGSGPGWFYHFAGRQDKLGRIRECRAAGLLPPRAE